MRIDELRCKEKGRQLYGTFVGMERTMVQLGMFPGAKMEAAQAELMAEFAEDTLDPRDAGRWLAVGVMDAADAGPEPLVV
jgi:hypothetical protein